MAPGAGRAGALAPAARHGRRPRPAARRGDRVPPAPGCAGRPRARRPRVRGRVRVEHDRDLRGYGADVRGARVALARADPARRARARGGAVRRAQAGRGVSLGGLDARARDRGRDLAVVGLALRRRRLLPHGARAEAARARLALAALGRRVPRRRPAPGLRVPALARRDGPARAAGGRRGSLDDPARPDRVAAALARVRLRGRNDALPLALGGRGDGARRVRAARPRARARRRLQLARTAGDRLPRARAPGAAGARLCLRPGAVGGAARVDRRRRARDDAGAPDLLRARRSRARGLFRGARRARHSTRRRAARGRAGGDCGSRGPGRPLAAAGRAGDGLAQPLACRAAAGVRGVRRRARRLRPAQLPPHPGAVRARGRDRGRRPRAAPARGLRPPPALGRVRARRRCSRR